MNVILQEALDERPKRRFLEEETGEGMGKRVLEGFKEMASFNRLNQSSG